MTLRNFAGWLLALALQPVLSPACRAEEGGLFHDAGVVLARTISDQGPIYTSPLRLRPRDALWLAPLGGVTAALLATDAHISRQVAGDSTLADISRAVSIAGSGAAGLGIGGAFYLAGRLAHDAHARETGMFTGEALFDSWILVTALKVAANRQRPFQDSGRGRFWRGGTSFPSGHSITAWTVAAVVAREYGDHGWVRLACYGGAALVGVSRVTGHQHFPSDVLVGSALGYLVGRSVFERRQGAADPRGRGNLGSRGIPAVRFAGSGLGATVRLETGW